MGIIQTDQFENLKVYHYQDGTTDKSLLDIRGIIKATEMVNDELVEKVVCKSFGYTPEVLVNDFENLNALISPMVTYDTKFFKAYEGTILRVWNYNGKWFLSTHRKINASQSKWGHSINYGRLFDMALEAASLTEKSFDDYVKLLEPNKVYVFLLRTFQANRKVCTALEHPTLYCIGSFNREKDFAFEINNPEACLPSPEQLTDIETPEQLIAHVNTMNYLEYQGVVLLNPDGTSGKLVNVEYDALDKLRGNEPNVLYRYVQLRWDAPRAAQFRKLYPEHEPSFDKWERVMDHVVRNILRKYIERFINRRTAILPPEQYPMLQKLQDLYHQVLKPQKQRVGLEHIWDLLGKMPEKEVNVMYKKYVEREKESGNGNRLPEGVRDSIIKHIRGGEKANPEGEK